MAEDPKAIAVGEKTRVFSARLQTTGQTHPREKPTPDQVVKNQIHILQIQRGILSTPPRGFGFDPDWLVGLHLKMMACRPYPENWDMVFVQIDLRVDSNFFISEDLSLDIQSYLLSIGVFFTIFWGSKYLPKLSRWQWMSEDL